MKHWRWYIYATAWLLVAAHPIPLGLTVFLLTAVMWPLKTTVTFDGKFELTDETIWAWTDA